MKSQRRSKRPFDTPGELTNKLLHLYSLPPSDVKHCKQLRAWARAPPATAALDKASLLSSIPLLPTPSYRPLHLLYTLLNEVSGPWPTLSLIHCHHRLTEALPKTSNNKSTDGDTSWLIQGTEEHIKQSYTSLTQLLPQDDKPALLSTIPGGHRQLSHRHLYDFVKSFALPVVVAGGGVEGRRKPVVAIALSNGPLLAAVSLAVSTYYVAAPIDPTAGPDEVQADVIQVGAQYLLVAAEEYDRLCPDRSTWTGVQVFLVDWNSDQSEGQGQGQDHHGISLREPDDHPLSVVPRLRQTTPSPNRADDTAIIYLAAKGAWGCKEPKALTLHSLVQQAALSIQSWKLTPDDVCLNMMPLNQMGALVWNILTPLLSHGSTICCKSFDASLFWDSVEHLQPTWYNASSPMHHVILTKAPSRAGSLLRSKIRMVCGDAPPGAVDGALACRLRSTFHCVVAPEEVVITGSVSDEEGVSEKHLKSSHVKLPSQNNNNSSSSNNHDREATKDVAKKTIRLVRSGLPPPDQSQKKGQVAPQTPEKTVESQSSPPSSSSKKSNSSSSSSSSSNNHGRRLDYLGDDGYLYIMGSTKEAIHRAGEKISPVQVEQVILAASLSRESPLYRRVAQVMAFSVRHDGLGEAVGVAIVSPPRAPRLDLDLLYCALRNSSLGKPRWPVVVVFMDDLPRRHDKLLRVKLAERLSLPSFSDRTPYLARHWEAKCPAPETPLSVSIKGARCYVDMTAVSSAMRSIIPDGFRPFVTTNPDDESLEAFVAPQAAVVGGSGDTQQPLTPDWSGSSIKRLMSGSIHNYLIPKAIHLLSEPLPEDPLGVVDEDRLYKALLNQLHNGALAAKNTAATERRVLKIFARILPWDEDKIDTSCDLARLGGDSLQARQLLSALRVEFDMHHLPARLVYQHGSVKTIAAYIDTTLPLTASPPIPASVEKLRGKEKQSTRRKRRKKHESIATQIPITSSEDPDATKAATTRDIPADVSETCSSTNKFLMLLQLLPLVAFYPMRRALQWSIFLSVLSRTRAFTTNDILHGRLFNLTFAIVMAYAVVQLTGPFIGIAAKWIIIGRYREGLYPMWGQYHTRWWMVQKIVSICGTGFFNANDTTKVLYCRLMGAKIGKNVKLAGARIGEWDLLDIRDGATLAGNCTCRPFGVEANTTMYLGRIVVGENASVGVQSIVAPGAVIPPGICIGPNSCSWELHDADESYRDLTPDRAPAPHWTVSLFLTFPLYVLAWAFALVPWYGGLVGLVLERPDYSPLPLREILKWFPTSPKVGFHYLALVLRSLLSPLFLFVFTAFLRKVLDVFFGKIPASAPARGRRGVDVWRAKLIKTILPEHRFQELTEMFGQHHEVTSMAVRMLGGKVGKRVYWPCVTPSVGDYHLLDIGDDVVIGSRVQFITSDGVGSEKIYVRDGADVSDRAALLPGVDIGEKSTLSTGALTRRGRTYRAGGTYVGSKAGDSVCWTTAWHGGGGNFMSGKSIIHMPSSDTLVDLKLQLPTPPQSSQAKPKSKTSNESLFQSRPLQHMASSDTLVGAQTQTPSKKSSFSDDDDDEKPHHFRPNTTKPPAAAAVSAAAVYSKAKEEEEEARLASLQLHNFSTFRSDAPSSSSSSSPFSRAFYYGQAPYHVLGQVTIFAFSAFMAVFTAFYWNVPVICSIKLTGAIFARYLDPIPPEYDILALYLVSTASMCLLTTMQAILTVAVVIGAKWALLGRATPGTYDWDKSPYCQRRWLFLLIERLIHRCYRTKGIPGMLTGTHWLVLYYRALGARIGQDCALFANGRPTFLFTEPDLITIGDRVAVDDAAVRAHSDVKGQFDLEKVEIGDRCVLRTGSSLFCGAAMRSDSCLLEHTLIMGGDVVGEGCVIQGWPAERFFGDRTAGLNDGEVEEGKNGEGSGEKGLLEVEEVESAASRSNSDATTLVAGS